MNQKMFAYILAMSGVTLRLAPEELRQPLNVAVSE